MQCQIIGNSADSLSVSLQQEYPDVEWDGMYGLRCAIAHSYGTSDFSMRKLWNIVRKDVPELIERLEAIIEDLESGSTVRCPSDPAWESIRPLARAVRGPQVPFISPSCTWTPGQWRVSLR